MILKVGEHFTFNIDKGWETLGGVGTAVVGSRELRKNCGIETKETADIEMRLIITLFLCQQDRKEARKTGACMVSSGLAKKAEDR